MLKKTNRRDTSGHGRNIVLILWVRCTPWRELLQRASVGDIMHQQFI